MADTDFSADEVVDIPFDKLLDNLQSPIPKTQDPDIKSESDRPAESVADSLLAEQQQQQLKNGSADYPADDDMSAPDENDPRELKPCPDCSEMTVSTTQCNTCIERKKRYLCFWCIGLFDDTDTLLEHEKCCSQGKLLESGSGEIGVRVKLAKGGVPVVLSEIGTQTGRKYKTRKTTLLKMKKEQLAAAAEEPLTPKLKKTPVKKVGRKKAPPKPKPPKQPKEPKPKRKTRAELKREKEEKTWDPANVVQCHICKKKFKNKEYLQKHNDLHHLLVPCKMCGVGVIRKDFHKHEKEVHNSEFKCTVDGCSKVFKSRHSLRDHETVHTGVRAFVCDECGKDFRTKDGLSKHKKHHKGLRPHICTYCGKRFTDSGSRKYHEGTHLKQRPTNFKCKFCGRGYKTYVGVYLHERIHTGKTFKCSYCNKEFNAKTHLTRHQWIHTGEFPYYCPLCQRNFRDVHAMKIHKCLSAKAGGVPGKPMNRTAQGIIIKEAEIQHQKVLAKSRLIHGKGSKRPRISSQKSSQEQQQQVQQALPPQNAQPSQDQLHQEPLHQERLNQERLNQERMNQERLNQERLNQERLSQERLSQERHSQERLGQERLNQDRLSQERMNQERLNQERQYPLMPTGFPDPRQDLRELQDLRDLRDDHHPPHHQIPRQDPTPKDNQPMHWGDGRMHELRQKTDQSPVQGGLQPGIHSGVPTGVPVPLPWTTDGRMPVPLPVPVSEGGLRHKDVPSGSRIQEQPVHHMDPMRQYRDVHTMMLQKYMAEQAGQAIPNLPIPPWSADGRMPDGWQREGHIQKLHSHAQSHTSSL